MVGILAFILSLFTTLIFVGIGLALLFLDISFAGSIVLFVLAVFNFILVLYFSRKIFMSKSLETFKRINMLHNKLLFYDVYDLKINNSLEFKTSFLFFGKFKLNEKIFYDDLEKTFDKYLNILNENKLQISNKVPSDEDFINFKKELSKKASNKNYFLAWIKALFPVISNFSGTSELKNIFNVENPKSPFVANYIASAFILACNNALK